ncbi:hypothetical protein [Candidatus Uabimicrobium amorphum]|uniref:Uncharacterized protein n=1 Tax=Uabimicrobium amorphum TaxID=2596890 RepID=A0A5S9ILY8_UABAM|nr:hypothetical protein [Candidatus Uabimicrobium amorphum]BBM83005.1 hypothetical protein UABAM_01348 [Candidatus Uabimicrobium amorphum]
MFSETTQLLILLAIFFFIMVPITIAKRGDNIVAKFLFRTIFFPFYLIRWWLRKKEIERRRRNYEILGQYVALLGNNSATLGFFRELIEKGIKEEELEKLIQANLQKMKDFDEGKKKEAIRSKLEEEMQMRELAQEQQTILSEAKMSLEQIKFREQLLDGLYQKIRRKYGL